MKYKYIDLYDPDFLNNFTNEQQQGLEKLDLDIPSDFKINVEKIIQSFDINLTKEDLPNEESGCYENNCIHINSKELPQRQKFTAAHELGHAILNSNQNQTFNRFINKENYLKIEDKINERSINEFAANLLMPQKLVDLAVNENKSFMGKELVNKISGEMCLSKSFVNYRLYNLNYVESLYYK
ncbi:ImmA/IrrE family metallo-endopeptidase [Ligilactobacillus aviarius]|uniref:ImmA/IrrE family metallo-endopeptidase n=1 Tax=Ligilactobacillus aviarius TaxID=1606 RepID=UPI00249F16F1|nr:ImmA/IrrE family metallo-endopeptidase [Ligilactobacillus aviarius]